MIENFKNILVLAPHTDDGELGAGGTIAKLIESGSKGTYAAFSTAAEAVPEGVPSNILKEEVAKATSALGIPNERLIIFDCKSLLFFLISPSYHSFQAYPTI